MSDFGYDMERDLGNGQTLYIARMTFGKWRLCVGPTGTGFYTDSW